MIFEDFIIRAILASLGIALVAGPLGCFIVWRRMAYFGDATAHAALLGVAMSLAFSISPFAGVLAISLAMAIGVTVLSNRGLAADTGLGVLSHGALAFGLIAVTITSDRNVDLMAYLIGDILGVGWTDVVIVWCGALGVLGLLWWRWTGLLTATVNPELAFASNYDPKKESMILMLALALTIAVAIKIIGALLIAAMMIVPAATARSFAKTPEGMVFASIVLGIAAALPGIVASFTWDIPTGPAIVSTSFVLFVISMLWQLRKS